MKSFLKIRMLPAVAMIAAAGFAGNASAEKAAGAVMPVTATGVETVSIPYSAAELTSDEARADLYGRIRHAARKVCGPTGLRETGSLTVSSRNRSCYQEAVEAAMSQVSSGQLAATGG